MNCRFPLSAISVVLDSSPVYLDVLQEGKSHLALVSDDPETTLRCIQEKIAPVSEQAKVQGIITLENIIEKIIREEIYDETDSHFTLNETNVNDVVHPLKKSPGYNGKDNCAEMPEMIPLLTRISSKTSSYSRVYGGVAHSRGTAVSVRENKRPSLSVRPAQSTDTDNIDSSVSGNMWQNNIQGKRIQRYATVDSVRSLKSRIMTRKPNLGDITQCDQSSVLGSHNV